MQYEWTRICRLEKGGHRLFRDERSGHHALADDSGMNPSRTEDGPCWLDLAFRPMVMSLDGTVSVPIRLDRQKGHGYSCVVGMAGAAELLHRFPETELQVPESFAALVNAALRPRIARALDLCAARALGELTRRETVERTLHQLCDLGAHTARERKEREERRVIATTPVFSAAHVDEFVRWRNEVDSDAVLDTFDLALGYFSGQGFAHDTAADLAAQARDRYVGAEVGT